MNTLWSDLVSAWNDLVRWWLELWGRRRPAPQFTFDVYEIWTRWQTRTVPVLTRALYINLHPTLYAVATTSDGKILNLKGGYNHSLTPGRYIIHYVDRQNRVFMLPMVTETTMDGSQVSLELIVTYRVADPVKALEVQQPVDTLFAFVQSDLKEFIRSHRYDEIVGGVDGRTVDNRLVAKYIKDQHAGRHQLSKLFHIADIVVEEKVGDPKLMEIKGNFQAQQRQQIAESEIKQRNKELEAKVAAQEAEITKIKAQAEATQQEIAQKMQMQGMELEKARAELKFRQEKMSRAMDAIGQAFSSSTYLRDPHEVEIIRELIAELSGTTTGAQDSQGRNGQPAQKGAPNSQRIDTLTDTLLNWLNRKRS